MNLTTISKGLAPLSACALALCMTVLSTIGMPSQDELEGDVVAYASSTLRLAAFADCGSSSNSSDLEKYNAEKEKVLNTILNSVQFDSIYSAEQVYFAANELLSDSTPITLKRGDYRAIVLEEARLEQMEKEWVSLGDFTLLLKEDPVDSSDQRNRFTTLLNLRWTLPWLDRDESLQMKRETPYLICGNKA